MKFAKEFERELVPEWRIKYLNYKAGKKHVKAVSAAARRANTTPNQARRSGDLPPHATPRFTRRATFTSDASGRTPALERPRAPTLRRVNTATSRAPTHPYASSVIAPQPVPGRSREGQRLATSPANELQYGSFVATPPTAAGAARPMSSYFELPEPAIERVPSYLQRELSAPPQRPGARSPLGQHAADKSQGLGVIHSASQSSIDSPDGSHHEPYAHDGAKNAVFLGADAVPPAVGTPKERLRRIFSHSSPMVTRKTTLRPSTSSQDEVRQREAEFYAFLDSELDKVETFYREKEDQAAQRLTALREQLHVMRNRRTQEMADLRQQRREGALSPDGHSNGGGGGGKDGKGGSSQSSARNDWVGSAARSKLFARKPGPNSKALQQMQQSPRLRGPGVEGQRDYVRRPPADQDVPYRTAKRKLKLALQEFYRGLELLKAYAILNRTAFRKLNKKYDKAVNARPQYRYMYERVAPSYFVRSTLLDEHIDAVEDLYARYFERGNHKLAAGKLRSLSRKAGDVSGSSFRSGLAIGVGAVFAVEGLWYGAELLLGDDKDLAEKSSYLLQVYGGYFLMLYLFVLFVLDCRIWTHNKINYQFIFEFDARSQLDWRQLSQFPSFFFLVFGVFIWINFSRLGSHDMFLYFPVVMIGVTVLILFFPARVFFYRSRRWFLYSHWRLLLAGLYPVEFRDFFLGDIYCSLTYAMCNIELFFCLYRRGWRDPEQCNSSHSRLLGFLAALPPIWRFLQCIRRYHDTGNVFPHLVNCGKYLMSIVAAMCLSLFRIDNTQTTLALFICFSTVNAIYTSVWDIFMDFSLLQPSKNNYLLRDITALKQKWPYYCIMVADPILRFAWIFYAIFTHDAQHSTVVSFMVAFAEVTRRGMWTIIRVENEHCSNVAQYKASRDVPLPYHLDQDESKKKKTQQQQQQQQPSTPDKLFRDDQRGLLDQEGSSPEGGRTTATQTPASAPTTATGIRRGSVGRHGIRVTIPETGDGAGTGAIDPRSAEHGAQSKQKQKQLLEPFPTIPPTTSPSDAEEGRAHGTTAEPPTSTESPTQSGIRRRLNRSGTLVDNLSRILAEAHKQDFEKKRRPAASADAATPEEEYDDEDDEDEVRYHNLNSGRAPEDTDEEDDAEEEDAGFFSPDESEAEDDDDHHHGGGQAAAAGASSGSVLTSAAGKEPQEHDPPGDKRRS